MCKLCGEVSDRQMHLSERPAKISFMIQWKAPNPNDAANVFFFFHLITYHYFGSFNETFMLLGFSY